MISKSSADGWKLTFMGHEQYKSNIREILDAVQSLLDANKNIVEKLNQANNKIEKPREYKSSFELKIKDIEWKNTSHNRIRFGGNAETLLAFSKFSRKG